MPHITERGTIVHGGNEYRNISQSRLKPGALPRWLHEQGVNLVIAGGMGSRAQALFADNGIKIEVGVGSGTPDQLVADYLRGALEIGSNVCDHLPGTGRRAWPGRGQASA